MEWCHSNWAVRLLAVLYATAGGVAIRSGTGTETEVVRKPPTPQLTDCSDLTADQPSGIYDIFIHCRSHSVEAYCEKDKDGGSHWTVIQRRVEGGPDTAFFLTWNEYENGFGDLNKEFWFGLEKLSQLTKDQSCEMLVELEEYSGETAYALYRDVRVAPAADRYRLSSAVFVKGNAGDGLGNHSVGSRFSTYDNDNDRYASDGCAWINQGAWWYDGANHQCGDSNLNGRNLGGYLNDRRAIFWKPWNGIEILKKAQIKIRPMPKEESCMAEGAVNASEV